MASLSPSIFPTLTCSVCLMFSYLHFVIFVMVSVIHKCKTFAALEVTLTELEACILTMKNKPASQAPVAGAEQPSVAPVIRP